MKEAIHILLLEDNPGDARLVRVYLNESSTVKVRLTHFDQLKAGLQYLDIEKPEVILLDLGLPDSQGLDTLTKITNQVPNIPVIVLTGLSDSEMAPKAVRAGAQEYLIKGEFNSDLLMRVIYYSIERKQLENTLRKREVDLNKAQQVAHVGSWIWNIKTNLLEWSDEMFRIFGLTPGEFSGNLGDVLLRSIHPDDLPAVTASNQSVIEKKTPVPLEYRVIHPDGSQRVVWAEAGELQLDETGAPAVLSGIVQDITERKRSETKIQRQLAHLTALSAIDRVITAYFDLKLSLAEILNHVTKELGVDAADVLVLNPDLQMLEFGAESGFRTKAIRKVQVRLGKSYAGRAALERRLIQITHLKDDPDNLFLTPHFNGEGFVCYYGMPLIAKGQVKGVLEVYHRTALEPDAEWFDFFKTLAGQTAIAIDNVTLFDGLQRSNLELSLAYDATIEGWSHALDLRDKETEGHTLRVAKMTVNLGRAFGLSEADLVQVRWGALLHDIGKMGVPDGILLKPEPLTDEDWVLMKKHPTFAYEMLSPIRYLRQALDIPYCHHEKWDGSGYPRGLKGNQIPLAARIFAVVDVWDALSSNRPYRAAWTKEKVHEHILASAGTHFDPQVVEVFMEIINQI
jgi:PAS domain S-box-containing protein/putative nucleotidyltransferase with HDIG domain